MDDPKSTESPVRIEELHHSHPQIRAEDWRSPLIARLLPDGDYADGGEVLRVSYRNDDIAISDADVALSWSGLKDDYDRCLNTYQGPVITEFAALAVACILCTKQGIEITEVTRRGEKVDYWLGDREALLEVSGTDTGDIEQLCSTKASQQLQVNPLGKDGFVCVARFNDRTARLWFYKRSQRAT